jgi:FtsP/CotA-like multicopper oxidase with cupredoxin domain
MLNRRDSIKAGVVAGIVLALPGQRIVDALASPALPAAPFTVPLPISPVLAPVSSGAGGDHYQIAVTASTARLLPGHDTPVLTYNGHFPGPTIRATRGRRATVTVTNQLSTPTAVHLHGGEVPQDSDGHPLDLIEPGGSRTYRYPNKQPAATLWYHDHAHHIEAEQVYKGLSGFYIIDDPKCDLRLPTGAYDIPLLVRDVGFTDDGDLLWELGGVFDRTTVLVNGVLQPVHTVERRKYRLRLLNCSNERMIGFRLSNGAQLVQIATDGGLMPAPVARTEIVLSPAERADVIVDFSRFGDGSAVFLENAGGDTDVNTRLVKFLVRGGRKRDDSVVPARLSGGPAPIAMPKHPVKTRQVVLEFDESAEAFLINGRQFDPHRVDFTIKRGSTEIWEIVNKTTPVGPIPHSLHLHLVQFRVLDRNGVPVKSWEAFPKDTVGLFAGDTVRILVRFDSEFTGRYPFHCHFIDHSPLGMMAQMEIVP